MTLRFHTCETDVGWLSLILSDDGLRYITMPRRSRDQSVRDAIEAGAADQAPEPDARTFVDAVKSATSGRGDSNGVRFDWFGITPFRRAVMEECMRIPAGQTRSYGDLAARVGRPAAARAVGRVMATNPFPFIVPCHRVVGSTGGLHGYGGGLDMKAQLLRAEGARLG